MLSAFPCPYFLCSCSVAVFRFGIGGRYGFSLNSCSTLSHLSYLNMESLKNKVQTLYFGGRHNGFTVYDKRAERMNHYKTLKLWATKSQNQAPMPTFKELYGFSQNSILTGIERKFGNGKVPGELSTLGLLLANALTFNPFDNIMFCPESIDEPPIDALGLRLYRKVITWNHDVREYGFDGAYKRLSRFANGNVTREWAEISAAAGINQVADPPVTTEILLNLYRNGINRQLGGIT